MSTNQQSSFVDTSKLTAQRQQDLEKAEAEAKPPEINPEEKEPPKNPLTKEEVAEIAEAAITHQYIRGYVAMGRTYRFRLWTVKDEEAWRDERGDLAAETVGRLSKKLNLSAIIGETLPMDLKKMVEERLSFFDRKFTVKKCLIAIDDKVYTPEEIDNMMPMMGAEEMMMLSSLLDGHRSRFIDLAVRSREEIKK
jgi:hypothetical protein